MATIVETPDVKMVLNRMDVLEQPVLPLEYVHQVFCSMIPDFLLQWMIDQKIPADIIRLFHITGFGQVYETDAMKNAGQVHGDLNDMAYSELGEALRILAKLGFYFALVLACVQAIGLGMVIRI